MGEKLEEKIFFTLVFPIFSQRGGKLKKNIRYSREGKCHFILLFSPSFFPLYLLPNPNEGSRKDRITLSWFGLYTKEVYFP